MSPLLYIGTIKDCDHSLGDAPFLDRRLSRQMKTFVLRSLTVAELFGGLNYDFSVGH